MNKLPRFAGTQIDDNINTKGKPGGVKWLKMLK